MFQDPRPAFRAGQKVMVVVPRTAAMPNLGMDFADDLEHASAFPRREP
jgi:hypothetical protein